MTGRLDKLLGGSPLVVDLFAPGVVAPAGTLPGSRLADYSSHRGRTDATTMLPDAGTCQFTVKGGLSYGAGSLALGTAFRTRLDAGVLGALLTPHGIALPELARFTGRLSDLGEVNVTGTQRAERETVAGATLRAKMGNHTLTESIVDSFDFVLGYARIALDRFWTEDAAARMAEWADNSSPLNYDIYTARWVARYGSADSTALGYPYIFADGSTLGELDLGIGTVGDMAGGKVDDLLSLALVSRQAVYIDTKDGRPDYATAQSRRTAAAAPIQLTPDDILAPVTVRQPLEAVINDVVINDSLGATTHKKDDQSIAAMGILNATWSSMLVDFNAAVASDVVARAKDPHWVLESVTVDLLDLVQAGKLQLFRDLLNMDLAAAIQITGLPAWSPASDGRYWVEAIDEDLGRNHWRMTLGLIEYSRIGAPARWQDIGATVRWADVPATVTWASMQTADWASWL